MAARRSLNGSNGSSVLLRAGINRMSLSGMKSRIRVGVPLVLSLPPSGSARESLVGRGEESREGRAAREADDFGGREHRAQLPVLSAS